MDFIIYDNEKEIRILRRTCDIDREYINTLLKELSICFYLYDIEDYSNVDIIDYNAFLAHSDMFIHIMN